MLEAGEGHAVYTRPEMFPIEPLGYFSNFRRWVWLKVAVLRVSLPLRHLRQVRDLVANERIEKPWARLKSEYSK